MLLRWLSSVPRQIGPQVCIIGSGPAGFYAAQYLATRLEGVQIDIYERLPVPFGLVRFGVAPDHFNLKKCINTFTKTAQMDNVRFLGNIALGSDVSLREFRESYNAVLLAYGVDDSKRFNIPGDSLKNIVQAKNFVGWYNGTPWDKSLDVDLSATETVSIFGHGNVAIDVARILLSPIDNLKSTDITEHSLEALSRSRVRKVALIGRRGPLQVSFTTKELRELLNLKDTRTIWRDYDMEGVPEKVRALVKPRKRLTELMVSDFQKERVANCVKELEMVFFRSPVRFYGANGAVKGTELLCNQLEGETAVPTGQTEVYGSDLVVPSIGYKSIRADPELAFDYKTGTALNLGGKIEDGLYTAGWLATGATGVLLHTMENAFSIASLMLKDLRTDLPSRPGFEAVRAALARKNHQVVTWADWLKIDEFERRAGEKVNKTREKVVDVEQMLNIAAK